MTTAASSMRCAASSPQSQIHDPPPAFSSTSDEHYETPQADHATYHIPGLTFSTEQEEAPPPYTTSVPTVLVDDMTTQAAAQRPCQPDLVPEGTGRSFATAEGPESSQGLLGRNLNTAIEPDVPPSTRPLLKNPTNSRAQSVPRSRRLSAFARDFYDTGPSTSREPVVLAPPSSHSTLDASPAASNRYLSPPFPPPSPRPSSPGAGQASSVSAAGSVPDDGRPTATPIPGHPFLKNGRVLVYPPGYECRRCCNSGYINLNPSFPCYKCWNKHAKPYGGAAIVSKTASAFPPSSHARPNFQRPLPVLRPPHTRLQVRQRSLSAPDQPPGDLQPSGPPSQPMCWRCDGTGLVSFMVIDSQKCPVCRTKARK